MGLPTQFFLSLYVSHSLSLSFSLLANFWLCISPQKSDFPFISRLTHFFLRKKQWISILMMLMLTPQHQVIVITPKTSDVNDSKNGSIINIFLKRLSWTSWMNCRTCDVTNTRGEKKWCGPKMLLDERSFPAFITIIIVFVLLTGIRMIFTIIFQVII